MERDPSRVAVRELISFTKITWNDNRTNRCFNQTIIVAVYLKKSRTRYRKKRRQTNERSILYVRSFVRSFVTRAQITKKKRARSCVSFIDSNHIKVGHKKKLFKMY